MYDFTDEERQRNTEIIADYLISKFMDQCDIPSDFLMERCMKMFGHCCASDPDKNRFKELLKIFTDQYEESKSQTEKDCDDEDYNDDPDFEKIKDAMSQVLEGMKAINQEKEKLKGR